ncbi:hypothetical protein SAMN02745126_00422 [Enhydrobacter aerosaccus]|uniref:Lipoprotein-attachment site-containing protein n=1 Tax=Enhydrobacter aerosaccus TaxID=225324 RepID=A0A1T4JSP8_9HYPH|nr:hypothetical protein [Enhydrobacter aerosaccus]SJZ33169.1 hypothetical protein SAMN02745126_00422 [Enhydrobacter aerosaccus]
MKRLGILTIVSLVLAACGFHSETVVQKPAPQPSTAVVVPSSPPPTTVYVPATD